MKIWFRYTHESTSFSEWGVTREAVARRRHTSYYKLQQMSTKNKSRPEIKTKDMARGEQQE